MTSFNSPRIFSEPFTLGIAKNVNRLECLTISANLFHCNSISSFHHSSKGFFLIHILSSKRWSISSFRQSQSVCSPKSSIISEVSSYISAFPGTAKHPARFIPGICSYSSSKYVLAKGRHSESTSLK